MSSPHLPKGYPPGSPITFTDRGRERTGTVIDRAPQGWGPYAPGSTKRNDHEVSGYWLWVHTDEPEYGDGSFAVRVRVVTRGQWAGENRREDGPLCLPERGVGKRAYVESVHDLYAEVYEGAAPRDYEREERERRHAYHQGEYATDDADQRAARRGHDLDGWKRYGERSWHSRCRHCKAEVRCAWQAMSKTWNTYGDAVERPCEAAASRTG